MYTMLRTIKLMAIALIFSGFASCDKDDDVAPPNPNLTFRATLSGASEVPPNTTTGTGTSTLIFNNDTKIFTITTTYSGLTGPATGAHIHRGAVGTAPASNVIFPFINVTVSPIIYTSAAITAAEEADLKAGLWYVNVHTALNPPGEIRGQLIQVF